MGGAEPVEVKGEVKLRHYLDMDRFIAFIRVVRIDATLP